MPTNEEPTLPDPEKVQAGILAVLLADREERLDPDGTPRKSEVILNSIGLNSREIALLTGKGQEAVKKTLQRARR